MKTDIRSISDIQVIVDAFYEKATTDSLIGHFFTEVMTIKLSDHLPIIYQFWDSVLFGSATYKGNVMIKHLDLHSKSEISDNHLNRWLDLWEIIVSEHYAGAKTEEIIEKARNIKYLMAYKISRNGDHLSIQ